LSDFYTKMINRYDELLGSFATKLRNIISEYQLLRAENQLLRRRELQLQDELAATRARLEELKKQNDHLVLANQLGGSGEDRESARQQLEKMVREIDQCLALLNK
jgi:predicted  nucleic acid-binding Zn-ribbon protein